MITYLFEKKNCFFMNAENLRIGDYVHIHFLKNTTTEQAKVENIDIENNTIIL